MKPTPGSARVLVATDNVDDANQILRQLKSDFKHVLASTNPDTAVKDFEAYKPHVLILAFDSFAKSRNYYLGLYRLSASLNQHRTIVLCSKDEVREVFLMCKKQYFDDYIVYWPHSHDGFRLTMSIWNACREMVTAHTEAQWATGWRSHAKHLGDLEHELGREFADSEKQIDAARRALQEVENEIAGAIDDFSAKLNMGSLEGWVEVKDNNALSHEIDRLKSNQIARAREIGLRGVEPILEWTRKLKDRVEPAMAGTRSLTNMMDQIRPVLMVVDDDEMIRQLVAKTLDQEKYELIFAGNSAEAITQLRRMRPDAILMDVRLPGMDGVSLTQRLKSTAHLADIPVIMMTGDSRRETLATSLEAGAAEFVVKPFTRESLTAKVEKVLRR